MPDTPPKPMGLAEYRMRNFKKRNFTNEELVEHLKKHAENQTDMIVKTDMFFIAQRFEALVKEVAELKKKK